METVIGMQSIDDTQRALAEQNYVCERSLATAIFLALKLQRPLFLEGEAGVGKTEIAKVLSAPLDRPLIRLQCYEGLMSTRRSTSGTTPSRCCRFGSWKRPAMSMSIGRAMSCLARNFC
ncbi:MAG: MoxR family ATPase [Caldilineaceae bacterium]